MSTRPGTSAEDPPAPLADAETVSRVLRDVARLGPFFAVATDPAEAADPTWRPLAEFDPVTLRGLIDEYARRLGTTEDRVAASLLFQALAARLWSPALAAASRGVVPDLSSLHWRWAPGAPIALWLAEPAGWAADGDAAGLVHRTVVDGLLHPVRVTFGDVVRVADGLLWGNAASALMGVLQGGTHSPGSAAAMRHLARELLARHPLAGTGSLGPGASFVRRSCCLYYRVPPGGAMCGDCALLHPARR
ncbi:(2Fe-2S)-binding protein [Actinomadura alba]|uniref:(2Fe-2S)-binding protein n=1 Tax=Actinomadura alba TaxID=406431 RepID=A0ABR7LIQ7_9ACTN|nr:(2Fe-2S)-binding protein [Actinomadura alba]MBC6464395.1 (2Fe-2S)-binding protein [Actinomadura alba]